MVKPGYQTRETKNPPDTNAVFIDWLPDDTPMHRTSLMDGKDFSDYRIAFFDPLIFAANAGLWSPDHVVTETLYFSLNESEFMQYLALIKAASRNFKRILERNGTIVLRARIPKSYIKVKKKSAASVKGFTESVVPTFFWLEDILGKYSFNSCNSKIIKFVRTGSPLAEIFRQAGADYSQTLEAIGKGEVETIAVGGPAAKSPVIARIKFEFEPGQVYLIPRFLIKDETNLLLKAFHRIVIEGESGLDAPKWLSYYQKQIAGYNIYRQQMDRLDLEIAAIRKQIAILGKQAEEIDLITALLFDCGSDFPKAVRLALALMGFQNIIESAKNEFPFFSVRSGGAKANVILVTAANRSITERDVKDVNAAVAQHGETEPVKTIIIGNALCSTTPDKRETVFDASATQKARADYISLVPSTELYNAACVVLSRSDSDGIETIRNFLRDDILTCEGDYTLNKRKYGV